MISKVLSIEFKEIEHVNVKLHVRHKCVRKVANGKIIVPNYKSLACHK